MTPDVFARRMQELKDSLPSRYQNLVEQHKALERRYAILERQLQLTEGELSNLRLEHETLARSRKIEENGIAASAGPDTLSPAASGDTAPSAPAEAAPKRAPAKHQHVAAWLDAAMKYAIAVDLARGFTAEEAKRVPVWARDLKALKPAWEALGPKELTRRWQLFCLDGDPFLENHRTVPYFAANTDKWRARPQKFHTHLNLEVPAAKALRDEARQRFVALEQEHQHNDQAELFHAVGG